MMSVKDKGDLETKLHDAGDKLVVLDFHASWCAPCMMILPVFTELAKEFPNAVLLKIDVDECEDIAVEYNISFMPTFFLIKRKNVITSFSGTNAEKLRTAIVQEL